MNVANREMPTTHSNTCDDDSDAPPTPEFRPLEDDSPPPTPIREMMDQDHSQGGQEIPKGEK